MIERDREFRIVGIVGSLREKSYNKGLLQSALDVLPAGVKLEILDISGIPLYNADLEQGETLEPVRVLREKIGSADALLLATPEYNYSVSAVMKNVIEWASRPASNSVLKQKPVAIMGAGGMFGTVRAQIALRQILLEPNALVMSKPEVMVMRAWEHFDADGNLTDESVKERVRDLVLNLVQWAERLRLGTEAQQALAESSSVSSAAR